MVEQGAQYLLIHGIPILPELRLQYTWYKPTALLTLSSSHQTCNVTPNFKITVFVWTSWVPDIKPQ
uniref:Uncharacterized protein n=1 Tax=Anguilla anguilla TaxID=7936 RepID=A0A0E9SS34_ANGAN